MRATGWKPRRRAAACRCALLQHASSLLRIVAPFCGLRCPFRQSASLQPAVPVLGSASLADVQVNAFDVTAGSNVGLWAPDLPIWHVFKRA